jgi:hypothetical protein
VSDEASPEQVAAHVLAHIQGAMQAVQNQDIESMIDCLAASVALYEEHPSYVQEPTNQLRGLLVLIRSGRSLCKTLARADDDLRDLEQRAEALRQSHLH